MSYVQIVTQLYTLPADELNTITQVCTLRESKTITQLYTLRGGELKTITQLCALRGGELKNITQLTHESSDVCTVGSGRKSKGMAHRVDGD